MYTLLHGALKNVGDFLIYSRAKQLLKTHTPETRFLEISRYEPLEPFLDQINRTRAVVLCGGPGYRRDFYPGTFALTSRLKDIKVPIVPFGLGWSGYPAGHPEQFHFTPRSLAVIRYIHSHSQLSSTRDSPTLGILRRHGIDSATMTGCPAWYDIPSIGRAFRPPDKIKQVVVTTPRRLRLIPQAIQLLWMITRQFPEAILYCVFHRGYRRDAYTSVRKAWPMRVLVVAARSLGYRIVNAAYDLSKISFYRECDLQVGYRVHAQINFLSMRKPSLLLCEDGRGQGLSLTLGLEAPTAYHNPRAIAEIRDQLRNDLESNFCRFLGITEKIDATYESALLPFLARMP